MASTFTKVVFCIIGLLIAFNVKAQKHDFVITANGDTINCKISKPFYSGVFRYKTDDGKSVKMDDPTKIKEYYTAKNNTYFLSAYGGRSKGWSFFTVIEKGKITLLEGRTQYPGMMGANGVMTGGSSSTEWYVKKGSDTVKEIKTSSWSLLGKSHKSRKNDFEEMISDNADVLNKYKAEDKFSFKQIRNLIHIYNTGEPLKED
ncbi:hypothetical protein [Mucilaginibacter aquariorum]|uniref:DUF4369 domain-containing protein n=1 Tax=Mucilaginibacter aquariorum TaxID=2967225 RepID=A0ABT1T0I5_9SPHI|nr:hypothetical protein [Mucilaginibacter aquariorum]MCQ6957980.1 hypothetical protein [Mucilaginibacter aquariorum]